MTKLPFARMEQLAEDLYVIEEMGSNIYLVRGSRKVLVLDTAYGLTDIRGTVRSLFGDMPVICVNSHEHPDHNAGNNQFDVVYVGRFGEPFSHDVVDAEAKQDLRNFIGARLDGYPFDYEAWTPGPAAKIEPVKDGDVFDLGGVRLTVLETPGHSLGEIALYEPEKRWLFTGDSVLEWPVWGQLDTSLTLRGYLDSLKKMAALVSDLDYVLPAHSVAGAPGETGRFMLPPEILTIYAEGTEKIVRGEAEGQPYAEKGPWDCDARFVEFAIGGMGYDPARI